MIIQEQGFFDDVLILYLREFSIVKIGYFYCLIFYFVSPGQLFIPPSIFIISNP